MNIPVGPSVARSEQPAPVVLVPKFPGTSPAGAHRRNIWLIAGLLSLAVIIAVGVVWWLSTSGATVRYTTAPVTRGDVTRTVTATGTVNPVLTIIVGSYVSGVIQELYCDYNTQVKKGQLCAKIDPRPYQTVVDQDKANLDGRQGAAREGPGQPRLRADSTTSATRKLAQTQCRLPGRARQRQERLRSGAGAGRRRPGDDRAAPGRSSTPRRSISATPTSSRRWTAPWCRATSRMGQTVAASFQTPTLFLIATDLTKMQVDTNVSESDIGGIKEGNARSFTVEAFPERTFDGVVTQVRQSPQTVQNVVTYDVVVSVDNTDLALKPGMTASTRIVIDQRDDVLRVPDQALRYTPGGSAQPRPAQPRRYAPRRRQQAVWVLRDGEPVAGRRDCSASTTTASPRSSGRPQGGRSGDRRPSSAARAEARLPCRCPRL